MNSDDEAQDEFIARPYQAILAEQALGSNKILFLPTGSGKTFIAIAVLKKMFHLLEPEFADGGKRAVFLVNTVALVDQQASVLERCLLVDKVGRYSGEMNVDVWDMKVWTEEFIKYQVMVMTAEILNKLLLQKYISLNKLALLILDECHHAVEDHPMRQIMKLFEDCPKDEQPKVIGLTATLLNGTPKSLPRVSDEVKKLEVTLHSTVATVNSWLLVKQFSTKPKEKFYSFDHHIDSNLLALIDGKIMQVHSVVKNFKFLSGDEFAPKRMEGFTPFRSAKKNDIANLLLQVTKQLGWLGPYGCYKSLQAIYVTLRLLQQKVNDRNSNFLINNLVCLLISLSRSLELFMHNSASQGINKPYDFSSSKVKCLVKLLYDFNTECNAQPENRQEPMQALIFVEEKMTAKILCSVLKNISRSNNTLGFIKAGFIVGGSYNPFSETWEGALNKHNNDKILERFRSNEINVLVATDVLEEGIDIPGCNIVVRFDMAKSFRSYIQSKGRARHNSSWFCLMSEKGELNKYKYKIDFFNDIYESLEKLLVGHTDDRLSPSQLELDNLYETEVEPYYTPTGSKVTMTSAISLVNGYCLSLAHDRFCKVSPTWYLKKAQGYTVVAIQLPMLSPFQTVVQGRGMANMKLAKRAAALEMCKMLHEWGELNDQLMLNEKCLEESDMNDLLPLWEAEEKTTQLKTGTTKKTRVYQMSGPLCFENCVPKPGMTLWMHLIDISPAYQEPFQDPRKHVIYSVLKEMKNFAVISSKPMDMVCQFPAYSKFGSMNVKIVSNMACISLTEEHYKSVTNFHWTLFTTMVPMAKKFLGFSKDSYLIAPTKPDGKGSWCLDWDAMEAFVNSSELRKDVPLKCVVLPTHRGALRPHEAYFVTRVCKNLNGHSAFPDKTFSSYGDYYRKKHSLKLVHLDSPLLEVQPFQVLSNDLLPRLKSRGEHNISDTIHFPIETCKVLYTEGCLFLKAVLLPSVLHRLERYLTANDLLCKINKDSSMEIVNVKNGNNCLLWREMEVLSNHDTVEVMKSLDAMCTLSVLEKNQTPGTKKKAPWGNIELPVDVERDFETVTNEEINMYGKFLKIKTSAVSSPYRAKCKPESKIFKVSPLQEGEGAIHMLEDRKSGPHPCHIMEATTAACANDFVNLERFETLGDSFLKFAVSFMLYIRFPELSEGKLTEVKGQIIGNRNLFYCAKAKQLGSYLKVKKVVPTEGWFPPSFAVPKEISHHGVLAWVKHLELSREEQFCNVVKDATMNNLMEVVQGFKFGSFQPQVLEHDQHEIPDKTVADCVESLIGAYLLTLGPKAAICFLEYMQVLPPSSQALLNDLSAQQNQWSNILDPINQTVKKVTEMLGYKFRNPDLLKEALTHSSSNSATKTYERLEFVGDAVCDFLITAYIYENCGKLTPGELTDLRSALVNNITFACLTVRHGFHKLLNCGSIDLMNAMDRFVRFQEGRDHVIDEDVLVLLEERECHIAETVDIPKALGDIFEALIGAVYLDSGRSFKTVWRVIYRLMKNEIRTFSLKVPKQLVRCLYEAFGAENLHFRLSESTKEMLLTQVHVVLTIRNGSKMKKFDGFGVNKAAAKKSAAKLALRYLKSLENDQFSPE